MSFCTLEYAKSQTGPIFSDGTFLHWERFMLWKCNFLWKHLAFSNSLDAVWNIEHDWAGQFLIGPRVGSLAACQGAGATLRGGLPRANNFWPARLPNPYSCSALLLPRSCWKQFSLANQGRNNLFFKISGLTPGVLVFVVLLRAGPSSAE